RPVLADPRTPIKARHDELENALAAIRREIRHVVGQESSRVEALRGQVSALGPASTLERGYSIVKVLPRDGDPEVVTTIAQAPPGSQLRIRVADGSITAAGMGTQHAD
ncbi:exodeoxyribonuclease VII large subunit, partial [Corynebacterium propinquum]|uniref:exodeoxyribonuclease VII large subunit n=1 Tax=Corynebacterium propinquum TaxID=43769 RepID=UPI000FA39E18